jgi:hypothetical protein
LNNSLERKKICRETRLCSCKIAPWPPNRSAGEVQTQRSLQRLTASENFLRESVDSPQLVSRLRGLRTVSRLQNRRAEPAGRLATKAEENRS